VDLSLRTSGQLGRGRRDQNDLQPNGPAFGRNGRRLQQKLEGSLEALLPVSLGLWEDSSLKPSRPFRNFEKAQFFFLLGITTSPPKRPSSSPAKTRPNSTWKNPNCYLTHLVTKMPFIIFVESATSIGQVAKSEIGALFFFSII
jgi:hypothetical protein